MHWPDSAATREDLAVCRAMLRGGSRTFYAASLLLPQSLRDPATALYAFCRQADDAVDLDGRREAVTGLRTRLGAAYSGAPESAPVDRAFAEVVARFGIPRALPEALLEGLAWDAEGRRYEELSDLLAYAARVAGSVGTMMALLMGQRDPAIIGRACELGLAMQITNIARDVGEDAGNGRVYLPLAWLRRAGIDADAWLTRPAFTPALGGVVEALLAEADSLYDSAQAGIECLPPACRPGIRAAASVYREIGRNVATRKFDSVAGRAIVGGGRKARLIAASLRAPTALGFQHSAPRPEIAFLVGAAANAPRNALGALALQRRMRARTLEERISWLIDLFARLERRRPFGQLAS